MAELDGSFFDISIDMLCCLDFSGRFRQLNRAWEKVLGFSIEELTSTDFIEFVHPDDRARTLEQNRRVRAGEEARLFENRYVCRDGSHRWLLWNAKADLTREVIYSVARDVTEAKRAAEEREALVERLQAALAEVRVLQGILPMCAYCKRVRDENDAWHSVEAYISRHTQAQLSHGICPSCYEKVDAAFDRDRA